MNSEGERGGKSDEDYKGRDKAQYRRESGKKIDEAEEAVQDDHDEVSLI